MRERLLRVAILFFFVCICAFAQSVGGGDPIGGFFHKITAGVVGVIGDILVLVIIWKLMESHHRGAGIVVGIVTALLNVYAIKHYQDIINWL